MPPFSERLQAACENLFNLLDEVGESVEEILKMKTDSGVEDDPRGCEDVVEQIEAELRKALARISEAKSPVLLQKEQPLPALDVESTPAVFRAADASTKTLNADFSRSGPCRVEAKMPLLHAVETGNFEEVQLALGDSRSIPKVNARYRQGCTLLHVAAQHGLSDIAGLLLSCTHFQHVNAKTSSDPLLVNSNIARDSVLRIVVAQGYVPAAAMRLLGISQLREASVRTVSGQKTALHLAASHGHLEVARLLLSSKVYWEVDAASDWGSTALHYAAAEGHSALARLLIQHRGGRGRFHMVNARDTWGNSALHIAAIGGHVLVASLLLEEASFTLTNAVRFSGETALHLACELGHIEVARLLLECQRFTEADAKVCSGYTALHGAAHGGHDEIVGMLLGHRRFSELNCQHAAFGTALHAAAMRGHDEAAQLLLDSARFYAVNATDSEGKTALHYAARFGHPAAVQVLLASSRFEAVNASDAEGITALHSAAISGHVSIVRLLLGDARFDMVNAQDKRWGRTALHHAVNNGRPAVVRTLLESKRFTARNALDSEGRTAKDAKVLSRTSSHNDRSGRRS
eukprot:gnl/TRDRNA2_/TRDRNA2_160349_c0_seq1.p1 gnl/TRDRNA2_/TRDRNA2_160349_c0~~gnl/TRDRNA2_/TRDRNA2_160349_c0_seq1.p1  ORF type:complete len:576 (+),score=86.73 gnl/TRDRNA2_/TRDRNA2_160349_c0_seq1:46-1773(+)